MRWSYAIAAMLALAGCISDREPVTAVEPSTLPIPTRIGWVDRCLAIKNDSLEPGTPVTAYAYDSDCPD